MIKDIKVVLSLTTELFQKGIKAAVQSIDGFQGKLDSGLKSAVNLSAKMEKIGQSAAIGFAGMGAVVFQAAQKFGQFEKTLNTIQAVSNITAQEMQTIKQSSLDLGAQTVFSNQQVAESYLNLSKAGFTAAEELAAMPGVLSAAAASGASLDETAGIVAGTLRGFNLVASESTHVADILAKAANISSADMIDLGYAMKQVAPSAVGANQSLEDVAAIMAALSDRMIKGADAGTDLKAILINLSAPSDKLAATLQRIGLNIDDGTGKMRPFVDILIDLKEKMQGLSDLDQTAVLERIAGKENIKSLQALLNMPTEKLVDMQTQIHNADGAAQKMADTMNQGLFKALEQLGGSIDTLLTNLGEGMAPAIEAAAGAITAFNNAFTSLPSWMQQFAGAALLAATALTGMVAAFGLIGAPIISNIANLGLLISNLAKIPAVANLVSSVIFNVIAVAGGFATEVGAMGTAVTAVMGIIGELTAAFVSFIPIIGQVIAAVVLLYAAWQTNFLGIQDITKNVLDTVGKFFTDVWKSISETFKQSIEFIKIVFNDLKTFFTPALTAIGNTFRGWFQSIAQWAGATWENLAKGATSLFSSIANLASQGFGWIVNFGAGMAKQVVGIFNALVSKIAEALKWLIKGANVILAKLGKPTIDVNALTSGMKRATDIGVNYLTTTWKKAGEAMKNTFKAPAAPALSNSKSSNTSGSSDKTSSGSALSSGGSGSDSGSGSKSKVDKAQKEQEKQSVKDLSTITDGYTQSLKENSIALDESQAKLSEYASKGAELALQLDKLKKDEQVLMNAQKQLQAAPTKGADAQQQKIEDLQKISNLLKQNKADQIELERDITQATAEEARKRADAQLEYDQRAAEGRNQLLKKQEDFEAAQLERQLQNKEISETDYLARMTAIKEAQYSRDMAMLTAEKSALDEKYKAMLQAKGFEDAADAESIAMKTQLLDLQNQLNMKTLEYGQGLQTLLQGTTDKNKPGEEKGGIREVFQTVQESFDTMLGSIITGTGKMSDAFSQMGKQIVNSLVGKAFKLVTNGLFDLAAEWLLKHTIMGKISEMFAKRSAQKSKAANVATATTGTGVWAINAASAVASIPIIGPALAQAAYAAAMAQGMATVGTMKGVDLVSFDVGSGNIPYDMPAQVHKGEIIVPDNFSSAIRSGQLSLSGPKQPDTNGAGTGVNIEISFAGANFMGNAMEMVSQIEQLLYSKGKLLGSQIQFGRS